MKLNLDGRKDISNFISTLGGIEFDINDAARKAWVVMERHIDVEGMVHAQMIELLKSHFKKQPKEPGLFSFEEIVALGNGKYKARGSLVQSDLGRLREVHVKNNVAQSRAYVEQMTWIDNMSNLLRGKPKKTKVSDVA